jgi:hypothetical protein
MTYKIITQDARTFTAGEVVEDVVTMQENVYYVFTGKHTQYANNSDDVLRPADSEAQKRQVYEDMLFGKKVSSNDARVMIDRHDYVSNTVYDIYDDADSALMTKKFYVNVTRGEEYDVFKCLDNNRGLPSTVAPDKNDITEFDEIYRTSDGYIWKYMYTIPSADWQKFATVDYMPVVANASVTSSAVEGGIDVIKVENAGSRFDNYLYGTLGKNDAIDGAFGSTRKYDVSSNNQSSNIDDFYIGCIFKIVSGNGAGSYSKIQSYDVYGNNRVVTLTDVLPNIDITSEFEITPEVKITGDFTQTINALARAIVNATGNTIDYVEILDRGEGYKSATAFVYASPVVPFTPATVRPIIGPYGGHGYDANNEMGASKVCFSVTFANTDGFPEVNDFRQVGVMINPTFSNVAVNFSSKDGTTFLSGETVYQIDPVRLFATDVNINTTSNVVSASLSYFDQLEANTILYIVGSSLRQLATITGITNSTHLTIDSDGGFACNDCEIYLANVSVNATVINDLFSGVAVSGLKKPFDSGSRLVGYETGASGVVDNIEVANNTTVLSTFNQTWKYFVITNDDFEEDEVIYQPTSAANSHGNLFGIVEDGTDKIMYISNQLGYINTGENVIGANSDDTAYIVSSYEPDLVYNSGRIIYLENIEKVARVAGQKETFKIIFSY